MSSREITELRSRVNSQMEIIDALRKENKALKDGSYTMEVHRLQRQLDTLRSELERTKTALIYCELKSEVAIPKEFRKRLVMLCHPDRHNNSEMSVKVSQWLNTQGE